MRYLAIDYGTKRTGLAICDASETVTSPLDAICGQKGILEKIANVVNEEGVEAIVVGLPLNMDDSEGSQAKVVLGFAEKLKQHFDIPVYFQDERLSSYTAEERLTAAEFSREKKKRRLDAIAAAAILEAFLEGKKAQ